MKHQSENGPITIVSDPKKKIVNVVIFQESYDAEQRQLLAKNIGPISLSGK